MKHYAPSLAELIAEPRLGQHLTDAELAEELLERARRRNVGCELLTDDQVIAELTSRLDGRNGEYGRLAADIGIAQSTLSNVLSGRDPISEKLAPKLGYRRVTRFERIG